MPSLNPSYFKKSNATKIDGKGSVILHLYLDTYTESALNGGENP